MKLWKIGVFFMTPLLFMACKKGFLDVPDKTVILKEAYVKDLTTLDDYLNGVYVGLAAEFYEGQYAVYPDLVSDNVKTTVGGFLSAHYMWQQNVQTANLDVLWQTGYRLARECSFVIEKSNEFRKEDGLKANRIKGQALALRALLHSYLVNLFAQSYNYTIDGRHPGIPYVTTSDREIAVSRQTVGEVYNYLVSDLQESIQLLPKTITSNKRMNYYAAEALLSRIYLFRQMYAASKDMALDVIEHVPLMQQNYPDKLYTDQETEALFQLVPSSFGKSGYSTSFVGLYFGYDIYFPTDDIVELLRSDYSDKRSKWVSMDTVSKRWIVAKFPQGVTGDTYGPIGDYYLTLFKSSEMYLNVAESYFDLNKEDSARFYVNHIRQRAGISETSVTGSNLRDSIYQERRKELAFDGMRMFDLLRWKKGVYRKDALSANVKELSYPNDKAIAPIPKPDVDLSHLKQNAGY